MQTSALAEPATRTTDHKHEALTSNGTFPFIAGSELKQIGYQHLSTVVFYLQSYHERLQPPGIRTDPFLMMQPSPFNWLLLG